MIQRDLVERLAAARLYVISADDEPSRQADVLCQAIDGGASVVQLRNKSARPADLLSPARRIRSHAHAHGAIFVVNDHLDLAVEAGADGVHLGQDDLTSVEARSRRLGLVGRSTHSLAQAVEAESAGVDYIGVGPVHETPTKSGRAAVGTPLLAEVKTAVSLPWFAIGGIHSGNIDEILAAGASRVAVVRAVCLASDPAEAAAELLRHLSAIVASPR